MSNDAKAQEGRDIPVMSAQATVVLGGYTLGSEGGKR
jgi:hypothetical protein